MRHRQPIIEESGLTGNQNATFSSSLPPSVANSDGEVNGGAFSLLMLFQIMTACGLFCACLRYSPVAAIVATILIAPAVIRTGLLSELYRRRERPFGYLVRLQCFIGSLGIVLLTAFFFVLIFLLVSMLFGLAGMVFSAAVGASELNSDAAIVGTASGMIWGFAAALLATGYVILRTWVPGDLLSS